MMNMEVNGTTIQVKLYENSSAEAVKELLKKGPFKVRKLWDAVSDERRNDYNRSRRCDPFGRESSRYLLCTEYVEFYEAWKGPESVRDRIETGTWKRKYYGSPDAVGRRITKRERFAASPFSYLVFQCCFCFLFMYF